MYVLGEGSLSCEAVDLAADIVEIEEEDDYIYCLNKEGMLRK